MPICRSSGNVALDYSVGIACHAPIAGPASHHEGLGSLAHYGTTKWNTHGPTIRSLLPMLSTVNVKLPRFPYSVLLNVSISSPFGAWSVMPISTRSVGSVITPALES